MPIEQMLSGPIPGESLTREPGNAPWEQPPRMVDVKHIVADYFDKLEDDEKLTNLLDAVDNGVPIERLVNSMLMYAEMNGEHDTNASILVAPVIHEYFKFLAESAGIDYVEFSDEDEKEIEEEGRIINDFNVAFDSEGPFEEPIEDIIEGPEGMEEVPPKGLIPRRQ